MELTIKKYNKIKNQKPESKPKKNTSYFTIKVSIYNILTVQTSSITVAEKWIHEVLHSNGKEIIVGVAVDQNRPHYGYRRRIKSFFSSYSKESKQPKATPKKVNTTSQQPVIILTDNRKLNLKISWFNNTKSVNTSSIAHQGDSNEPKYDIIQLCVDDKCLIFELPGPWERHEGELPFTSFFSNPRVTAAGVHMEDVSRKLLKDHKIRVTNMMDLNEEAKQVHGHDLYPEECYLNELNKVVLGRWFEYKAEKVAWHESGYRWWHNGRISNEKVMYATYEAYLSFMMGTRLMKTKKCRCGGTRRWD